MRHLARYFCCLHSFVTFAAAAPEANPVMIADFNNSYPSLNQLSSDGYLVAEVIGDAPSFSLPNLNIGQTIPTAGYDQVRVRMWLSATATGTTVLHYLTDSAAGDAAPQSVVPGAWADYMFPVAGWTGNLKSLSLDPVPSGHQGVIFKVDYAELVASATGNTLRIQDFAANPSKFPVNADARAAFRSTATGGDPYMTWSNMITASRPLLLDTAVHNTLRFDVEIDSTTSIASQVWWGTNANNGISSSRSYLVDLPRARRADYFLLMRGMNQWTGNLDDVRLDPGVGTGGMTAYQLSGVAFPPPGANAGEDPAQAIPDATFALGVAGVNEKENIYGGVPINEIANNYVSDLRAAVGFGTAGGDASLTLALAWKDGDARQIAPCSVEIMADATCRVFVKGVLLQSSTYQTDANHGAAVRLILDRAHRSGTIMINGATVATASNLDFESLGMIQGQPRIMLQARKGANSPNATVTARNIGLFYQAVAAEDLMNYTLADVIANQEPAPVRAMPVHEDAASRTGIVVSDESLDLQRQVTAGDAAWAAERAAGYTSAQAARQSLIEANAANPATAVPVPDSIPVSLAPRMAAGEEAAPENHTFVVVLDKYQMPQVRFLAYPPSVRGGVEVTCGDFDGTGMKIATTPASDAAVNEIRLFNEFGGLQGSFQLGSEHARPCHIEAGRFVDWIDHDLIAAVAPSPLRAIFYRPDGAKVATVNLPGLSLGNPRLTRFPYGQSDALLVHDPATRQAVLVYPNGATRLLSLPGTNAADYLSPDAFDDERIVASRPGSLFSYLDRFRLPPADGPAASEGEVNIGSRENLFRVAVSYPAGSSPSARADGAYVREMRFRHIRTDTNKRLGDIDNYLASDPSVWEPTASHREFTGVGPSPSYNNFKYFAGDTDPARNNPVITDASTGFPKYYMLGRLNTPDLVTDFGGSNTSSYLSKTWALNDPNLDQNIVTRTLEFTRQLAPVHRANPEHFVAIEPCHEWEIPQINYSIGDYNPLMVRGFWSYLLRKFGSLSTINARMGTPFVTGFDAPRGLGRGSWDAIDAARNPYWKEWVLYNRYVINRRLSQVYSVALGSGFAPETIVGHQIPDFYAVGSLTGEIDNSGRITPIDYSAGAGTNFGCTRYSLSYTSPTSIFAAANSMGFRQWGMGEYSSNNASNSAALAQLQFLNQNGCAWVHYTSDKEPAVLDSLFNLDAPRPGVAGGTAQVRVSDFDGRKFNIANLGTDPKTVGLLKSLDANGNWEGSIYAVPFRSKWQVTAIPLAQVLTVTGAGLVQPLGKLKEGAQFELTFTASGTEGTAIRIAVRNEGAELPGMTQTFAVGQTTRNYRYILRGPLQLENVDLVLSSTGDSVTLAGAQLLREEPNVINMLEKKSLGAAHQKGFSFDLLDRKQASTRAAKIYPPGSFALGQSLTVGAINFHTPATGSSTLAGGGNSLAFGVADPVITVPPGVSAGIAASTASSDRDLNVSLGDADATLVLGGSAMAFDSIHLLTAGTLAFANGASVSTDGTTNTTSTQNGGFRFGTDHAVLNINGGLTMKNNGIVNPSGRNNTVTNVNAGANASVASVTIGWNGGNIFNMNDGSFTVTGSFLHRDSGSSFLKLKGGILTATRIASDSGTNGFHVDFMGGTLKAGANNPFLHNTDKDTLANFRIDQGGAVIDLNGKTAAAVQPFTRLNESGGGLVIKDTGSGVTGSMVFTGGSYTGDTLIQNGTTLALDFTLRSEAAASGVVADFLNPASRLVLDGGHFTVNGRAASAGFSTSFKVGGTVTSSGMGLAGNTSGLVAGMSVTGAGIPANTHVAAIADGSRVIFNSTATNSTAATVPLVFGAVNDTTTQTLQSLQLLRSGIVTVNTNGGPGTILEIGAITQGTNESSLTKSGNGTLKLTGTSAHTGPTLVSAGTLALQGGSISSSITVENGAFLGFTPGVSVTSTGTVALTAGAKIKITGTPTLESYTLITATAISGTPALDSPLPGYSLVVHGGNSLLLTTNYQAWSDDIAGGQGPSLDWDNDGVSNGVEYFMNSPAGFTANPALTGGSTVTWTNGGKIPSSAYGVRFVVQTSNDLVLWLDVPGSGDAKLNNTDVAVSYTLPAGRNRFVRLKVMPD